MKGREERSIYSNVQMTWVCDLYIVFQLVETRRTSERDACNIVHIALLPRNFPLSHNFCLSFHKSEWEWDTFLYIQLYKGCIVSNIWRQAKTGPESFFSILRKVREEFKTTMLNIKTV